jgi:glycine/D-amino acid oxidase-like deaminating enzyme
MITPRRDLRSGRTYWQSRRAPPLEASPLRGDAYADVLVIGAGITGAVIGEMLSEHCRIVVVDRRGAAEGSTLASTALVEYEIDTPLTCLARAIGKDRAIRAWQRSHRAVRALAERTAALKIACDFVHRDSLYLCGPVLDAAGLLAEADERNAAGLETRWISRGELVTRYGIDREAGVLAFGDFSVDPRRMAIGYLKAAIARGARLFAPTDITGIEAESEGGIVAISRAGPVIRARHAVLATGYEVIPMVPPGSHKIISTYAIATRPQPQALWRDRALISEAADPYLYLRTTTDGRVLCGGEDEPYSSPQERDALIEEKAETLAGKLEALLPQIDPTPEFAWAGAFGTSDTGLPSIGEVPGLAGTSAVLGFGGNGMTYSRIAAEIITAGWRGKVDPDSDLYAFSDDSGAARAVAGIGGEEPSVGWEPSRRHGV